MEARYLFTQINYQHKYLWIFFFRKIQHRKFMLISTFYKGAGRNKQNFIHFQNKHKNTKETYKKSLIVIPNLFKEREKKRGRENCN